MCRHSASVAARSGYSSSPNSQTWHLQAVYTSSNTSSKSQASSTCAVAHTTAGTSTIPNSLQQTSHDRKASKRHRKTPLDMLFVCRGISSSDTPSHPPRAQTRAHTKSHQHSSTPHFVRTSTPTSTRARPTTQTNAVISQVRQATRLRLYNTLSARAQTCHSYLKRTRTRRPWPCPAVPPRIQQARAHLRGRWKTDLPRIPELEVHDVTKASFQF